MRMLWLSLLIVLVKHSILLQCPALISGESTTTMPSESNPYVSPSLALASFVKIKCSIDFVFCDLVDLVFDLSSSGLIVALDFGFKVFIFCNKSWRKYAFGQIATSFGFAHSSKCKTGGNEVQWKKCEGRIGRKEYVESQCFRFSTN
ncbi:hypothetical protein RHMOL_Rhmol13G0255600 [Rhododendron molle]|uniref:Uncharacterized protein n=1 Tax=Rhododendron molle TaxID=49168 RepID=A0ACC0LBP3_RHOML|nr:hypothetical protein RHMOL_Rhmol13G0255600 [Rhododendron molle]